MTDLAKILATLRRPRLLVRAARLGTRTYSRDRDLKQILRMTPTGDTSAQLLNAEIEMEETRQRGDTTYSIQSHVAVLTALIAEARMTLPGGVMQGA